MKPDSNIKELPLKGNTVIGNDVWIGQNATILPGMHIGYGAIIGLIPIQTDSNIKYVKMTLKKIINGQQ